MPSEYSKKGAKVKSFPWGRKSEVIQCSVSKARSCQSRYFVALTLLCEFGFIFLPEMTNKMTLKLHYCLVKPQKPLYKWKFYHRRRVSRWLFNSNNIIKWISLWFMITAVSPGLKFERNRSLKLAMIPNFISWNRIIYVYKRKLQADLLRKISFVTDDFPQSKFYLLNRT